MDVNPFLGLLILPLISSYILSSSAIPTSRSLISIKEDPSTTNLLAQGVNADGKLLEVEGASSGKEKMEMASTENRDQESSSSSTMEMIKKKNEKMKKKMDIDITDYGPPRSNPRHDPRPPHPTHA